MSSSGASSESYVLATGAAAVVLNLLKRSGGATAKELMKATGWQPHSVRGCTSRPPRAKTASAATRSKPEPKRSGFPLLPPDFNPGGFSSLSHRFIAASSSGGYVFGNARRTHAPEFAFSLLRVFDRQAPRPRPAFPLFRSRYVDSQASGSHKPSRALARHRHSPSTAVHIQHTSPGVTLWPSSKSRVRLSAPPGTLATLSLGVRLSLSLK
jgi:hypothetical protein